MQECEQADILHFLSPEQKNLSNANIVWRLVFELFYSIDKSIP